MKAWLIRLGLLLVLLGFAACSSGPTTKQAQKKPDATVNPEKPPTPPPLQKPPPKTNKR